MDNCLLVIGFLLHLTSASSYNQHWPVTDDWHKPQAEWHQSHQDRPKPQGDLHKPHGDRDQLHQDWPERQGDSHRPHEDWDQPHQDWPERQGDSHKPHGDWDQPHQDWPNPQGDSHKPHGDWHQSHQDWPKPQGDSHKPHGDWDQPHQDWPKPQGDSHKPHGDWHKHWHHSQDHHGDWQTLHGEWHTPHGDWHQSHTDWHKPQEEYHIPHGDHHKPHGECIESQDEGHNSHGDHHNSYSNHGYKPPGSHQWNTHESFEFPDEDSATPNPILILECLVQCPFSQTVAPVCGTNKFTYGNVGKLLCAKKCGVEVDLLNMGPCSDTSEMGTNVPDIPVVPVTPPQANIQQCISTCRRTSEYNPVCGTNRVLYDNLGALECARQCGLNVKLLRQGFCPLSPTPNPLDINTKPTQRTSNGPNSLPVTSNPLPINPGTGNPVTADPVKPNISQTKQCLASCPVSSENKPVCGTDRVIYQNLSKLQCAAKCGNDVSLLQVGICPEVKPGVETTVKPTIPPELSFDVRFNVENTTTHS